MKPTMIGDLGRIDRSPGADRNEGNRPVDSDLPAIYMSEGAEGFRRHEDDDHRSCLCAELKSERGRYGIIIFERFAFLDQCSLAIFSTDPNACLDDRRENQDGGRFGDKLARAANLAEKRVER